jgi:hypothetical protein
MNNDDISVALLLSNFLHAPSITDIAPLTRVLQSSGYSSPAAYPQGGGGGIYIYNDTFMLHPKNNILYNSVLHIHPEAFYS